jgi:O-antigen/teichoic acid export membrane protein
LGERKSFFTEEGILRVTRNATYILSGNAANFLVRLLYIVLLASYLGPGPYGLLNYGISWYLAFLPLTGLGLGILLGREIGRDRRRGPKIVGQTLTIKIVLTVVVAGVCAAAGWYSEGQSGIRHLLMVFSLALIGRSLYNWSDSVFTACESNRFTLLLNAVARPFEVVVGLICLLSGTGIVSLASVHAFSWWFQGLWGLWIVHRKLVKIRLSLIWKEAKGIIVKGLPIALGIIIGNWMFHGPLILFRHITGDENSLGQLALAMQAFQILSTFTMAANWASLPALSRSFAQRDGRYLLFAETMLRASIVFGMAGALLGEEAGPWIVPALFGDRFMASGELLSSAMWLLIPWNCGTALWMVNLAGGRFLLSSLSMGMGALAMTLSMPWFLTALDATGAILATALGGLIWAFSQLLMVLGHEKLDLGRAIWRPGSAALASLLIFFALTPVGPWVAVSGAWLALFITSRIIGVITASDWHIVVTVLRGRAP